MQRFARLHAALDYAAEAHQEQTRKGTSIAYLSHLMGVSSLVIEHGGDESQAIAALLHDVVEDCGREHEAAVAGLFGHVRSSMPHLVARPALVAGGTFGLPTLRYSVRTET